MSDLENKNETQMNDIEKQINIIESQLNDLKKNKDNKKVNTENSEIDTENSEIDTENLKNKEDEPIDLSKQQPLNLTKQEENSNKQNNYQHQQNYNQNTQQNYNQTYNKNTQQGYQQQGYQQQGYQQQNFSNGMVTPDKLALEPAIACIISIFIPGLGQAINGQIEKGMLILFGGMAAVFLVSFITCGIGAVISPLLPCLAAIDAYKCAVLLQRGIPIGKYDIHIGN